MSLSAARSFALLVLLVGEKYTGASRNLCGSCQVQELIEIDRRPYCAASVANLSELDLSNRRLVSDYSHAFDWT